MDTELILKKYEKYCIGLIKSGIITLKDVEIQTKNICLASVIHDSANLRYVGKTGRRSIKQDKEICLAAIKPFSLDISIFSIGMLKIGLSNKNDVLKYVDNQTVDICLAAIAEDIEELSDIRNQTTYICCKAIEMNPFALEYIKNQTKFLIHYAIDINYNALQLVRNQTKDIVMYALKKSPEAIKYSNYQDDEICCIAIKSDISFLIYVINQTEKVCLFAVQKNPKAMKYIRKQTEDLCIKCLQITPKVFKYIRTQTAKICKYALVDEKNRSIAKYGLEFPTIHYQWNNVKDNYYFSNLKQKKKKLTDCIILF